MDTGFLRKLKCGLLNDKWIQFVCRKPHAGRDERISYFLFWYNSGSGKRICGQFQSNINRFHTG